MALISIYLRYVCSHYADITGDLDLNTQVFRDLTWIKCMKGFKIIHLRLENTAVTVFDIYFKINPLKPELNSICYLLALLGAHHFLHVSRIRVKSLTFRLPISYIYGAPILDVSRSHTTTQHSR